MDMIKPYSRRSFWLIFVIMVLLAGALAGTVYVGKTHIAKEMTHLVKPDMSLTELLSKIHLMHETYALHLVAIAAGSILILGFLLWLMLRRTARRVLASTGPVKPKAAAKSKKRDDQQQLENRRLFLHLLVVLQREGRLLDFFQEDLDMYEDDQIGAAVRNIHSSCRKIIKKSLSMEPIISGSEGEEMTVEDGFDPDAIKLTGRVTGEPPFKGIIRHKGWRAKKLDLPDLSAIKDPAIISPAEVEIE